MTSWGTVGATSFVGVGIVIGSLDRSIRAEDSSPFAHLSHPCRASVATVVPGTGDLGPK